MTPFSKPEHKIFLADTTHLFGSLYTPIAQDESETQFIIFVHGWAGYRTGPHGMFLEMARKLVLSGFYCLLFDFRGRGFSGGSSEKTTLQSMRQDLAQVVDSIVKEYRPETISLVGICSGAKLALHYAKSEAHPIARVVELSSPPIWKANQAKVERARASLLIGEYFRKVRRMETWKKIWSREINYRRIFKILSRPVMQGLAVTKKKQEPIGKAAMQIPGGVLMIHGERDPETPVVVDQIRDFLDRNQISYRERIIPQANHSFYGRKWKAQILDEVQNFLEY